MSEEEIKEIYKITYMQNPFDILTKENLDRLEKHCKKAIHYERGNIREEHEIVLQLIYAYQDSVPINRIRDKIKLFELEIETLKTLYPKTYTRNSDYLIYVCKIKVLKELLEEKGYKNE